MTTLLLYHLNSVTFHIGVICVSKPGDLSVSAGDLNTGNIERGAKNQVLAAAGLGLILTVEF